MDYMEKRNVKRVLKGLNEEIRWAQREIRRCGSSSRASSYHPGHDGKQASLQRYKHLLSLDARMCHLKLAFMNGTPYSLAESTVKKSRPQFEDDAMQMQTWAQPEKIETYIETVEYSYSLAG